MPPNPAPPPAGPGLAARYPAHWPADLKTQLRVVAEAYTAAQRASEAIDAYRKQGGRDDIGLYATLRDANARYAYLVRSVRPALRTVIHAQRVMPQHIAMYCAIDLAALTAPRDKD